MVVVARFLRAYILLFFYFPYVQTDRTMTLELKIGDIVLCMETHQALYVDGFHPVEDDIVIASPVGNVGAGCLYVPVESLVKRMFGKLHFVHHPRAAERPSCYIRR